jgi:hypothetical protein
MFQLDDRLKEVPLDRIKRLAPLDPDARRELFRRRLGQICGQKVRLRQIIKQHTDLITILKGDPLTWGSSIVQLESQIKEAKQLL